AARLWDVRSGKRLGALITHRQTINSAVFSRDDRFVVTASDDKTARVWSAKTGEPVSKPMRHNQSVVWAGFSGDGSRVFTISNRIISINELKYSYPRDVQVWNASAGDSVGRPIVHE